MASPTATQHVRSNLKIQVWDHDPDTASALVVSSDAGTTDRYMDMRDLSHFAVIATNGALTGAGITKLEIVAATDTSGTNLTVIKDSGTVAADALGDWVMEECTAEEVAQEGADAGVVGLRYVAGRLTLANSSDESIVTYIGVSKRPGLDLTPASTIA